MDFFVALVLALILLFLAYYLLDVNYFIRTLASILIPKFFRKKIKILETSETYGIVLLSDADFWITHMNNARVFREFDFGRMEYLQRTGLLKIIIRKNAGGVVSSQTCRYRRPIHMFTMYKLNTSIVYFEEKTIYFEQQIVSLRDGIIRCTGYVKLVLNVNVEKLVEKYYPDIVKPNIPKDLQAWMNYNRESSEKLSARKSSMKTNNKDLLLPDSIKSEINDGEKFAEDSD